MLSVDSVTSSVSYALFGAKKVARRQADLFTRMATLEARGAKRSFVFFLPFMFFAFGFVLGELCVTFNSTLFNIQYFSDLIPYNLVR